MIDFLLPTSIAIILIMTIGFCLSLIYQNSSIVDGFWPLGIIGGLWATYSLHLTHIGLLILCILATLWGVRLCLFLTLTRLIPGHKDHRYTALESKWSGSFMFKSARHFYVQAALQLLVCTVSVPLLFADLSTLSPIHGVAIAVFSLALAGESIADWQLYQFKQSNQHGICRSGLWNHSRHPNYFFEWLIWVSLSLLSWGLPYWIFATISPLSMWVIMRYITGPYTEAQSVIRNGHLFEAYQRDVPMIIPSLNRLINRS